MSTTRTQLSGELERQARAWVAQDPDPATRAELQALLSEGDPAALESRFARPLTFGTAGLRGALGAGPARMNRLVVRLTTAGLARWIRRQGQAQADAGVIVGHDARHGSAQFALDAAAVLSRWGIRTRVFNDALPTPLTSFAVRQLKATAGVMITASHNPATDNGYKLYLADGAQVIPPVDTQIAAAAAERDEPTSAQPRAVAQIDGRAYAQLFDAYRADMFNLLEPDGPRDLKIVYTPIHGVGGAVTPLMLRSAGFPQPIVVPEQAEPDPNFPTAPYPNPEEPGVLDLALALARDSDADLMLANDPDADRLAVAVPDGSGEWRTLTGDQLGILLANYRIAATTGPGRLVASSVASSTMLEALATARNVAYERTPTGFKWIARAASRREGHHLLLGYEEALGYALSEAVADKDGVSAALATAAIAASAKAEGRSLLDLLADLYAELGVYKTVQCFRRADTPKEAAGLAELIGDWRRHTPTELAGMRVTNVRDLASRDDGYPPTDGLVLQLGTRARVVLRRSGTEPKLKAYLETRTDPPTTNSLRAAERSADHVLQRLRADVTARLGVER